MLRSSPSELSVIFDEKIGQLEKLRISQEAFGEDLLQPVWSRPRSPPSSSPLLRLIRMVHVDM
jgi:hypothetical protein